MIYSEGTYNSVTGVFAMQGAVEIAFSALYIGDRLFWQRPRSCYGTGVWLPERPWLDNDMWKNNK